MPRATPGVLVQCDASIKAIIVKIDTENNNDFIVEDIDDETVLIKSGKHEELKQRLKMALQDTVREAEDSGSD
ncbi:RNA polymerase II transcription factor B subunit 5 [Elsinoe australis]|uniref:General transcription and DNA repair factor IIH subunit TFB5 n=1 Tax=Elsinoe australis TaxID=40998 RepID=A0A2P8AE01_9PEZI|nr:hypothetical protein B9Z65_6722 [Elsinoe australis]TKX19127.1 RNA polymerase II transcription factor B subunit 5 [Elsinoe australis]